MNGPEPSDGDYDPTPIALCSFESSDSESAWNDEDPRTRADAVARRIHDAGRLGAPYVDRFSAMIRLTIAATPRTASSNVLRSVGVLDRMRAMRTMDPDIAKALGEADDRLVVTTRKAFRSLGEAVAGPARGILSNEIKGGRRLRHGSILMPVRSHDLARSLSVALASRAMALHEEREDGADAVHFAVTGEETQRAALTAAAQAIASNRHPFCLDHVVGRLHPLAWAVMQATAWRAKIPVVDSLNAARAARRGTRAIRAYRNLWGRASRAQQLEETIAELVRSDAPVVGAMPCPAVMDAIRSHLAERRCPDPSRYEAHLSVLSRIHDASLPAKDPNDP